MLLFIFYFLALVYLSAHESVHKYIFSRYGIDSKITINYLTLSAKTMPGDISACNDFCKTQQAANDIIGYTAVTIVLNLWALLIAFYLFKKWTG